MGLGRGREEWLPVVNVQLGLLAFFVLDVDGVEDDLVRFTMRLLSAFTMENSRLEVSLSMSGRTLIATLMLLFLLLLLLCCFFLCMISHLMANFFACSYFVECVMSE